MSVLWDINLLRNDSMLQDIPLLSERMIVIATTILTKGKYFLSVTNKFKPMKKARMQPCLEDRFFAGTEISLVHNPYKMTAKPYVQSS